MTTVIIIILLAMMGAYAVMEGVLLGRAEGIIQKVEDKEDKIMVYMVARNGKYVVMTFETPVKKLGGGYDLDKIRSLDLVGKRCVVHLIKQNRVDKFYLIENGKKVVIPKIKDL